jgi:hypothetical protein
LLQDARAAIAATAIIGTSRSTIRMLILSVIGFPRRSGARQPRILRMFSAIAFGSRGQVFAFRAKLSQP